jgi:formylmethanofuran dehydrogenase subunit C
MPLILRWRGATTLPVEASALRPETFLDRSTADAARVSLLAGNRPAELGELFAAEGTAGDGEVVVEGDLRQVSGLGRGMAQGRLVVRGDAGAELGAGMTGGLIEVEGSAGDWAAAELRGGMVRIRGSAGRWLGAAYPGSRAGMREGVVLIGGSIGDEAGLGMRRGLIAVAGAVGQGLGRGLIAGSIFAFGAVGRHAGAGMKRGTLALLGPEAPDLLPTFAPSGPARPPFLALYLRRLREWGFPVPEAAFAGPWDRYNGDLAERGQGEIWVGLRPPGRKGHA